MEQQQNRSTRGYDVASAFVWFVAISQGLVPLVVHGVFGREDRIALPLLLPAPWWWLTCLAVLVLAVVALLGIDAAKESAAPEPAPPLVDRDEEPETSDPSAGYDALSGLVLLVGIYNGLAPFVSRLVFDGDLFLALTLRLPSPWWWLASLAVLALTVVLLERIDRAKTRSTGSAER
ncbi:hypothetical protein SAMN05660485_01893 [Blastococcus fimeti]|nr:hypothetical protein SAMN05660485_01893 [Blastococcus fimeti]